MKLNVKMNLVQKLMFSYPPFEIDTADYPELEGKTLDDIRAYIEKNSRHMHSRNGKHDNLLEELSVNVETFVLEDYPDESHFYVTTEEENKFEEMRY